MSAQVWFVEPYHRKAVCAGEWHWWSVYTYASSGGFMPSGELQAYMVRCAKRDPALAPMAWEVWLWAAQMPGSVLWIFSDEDDLPWDDDEAGWRLHEPRPVASQPAPSITWCRDDAGARCVFEKDSLVVRYLARLRLTGAWRTQLLVQDLKQFEAFWGPDPEIEAFAQWLSKTESYLIQVFVGVGPPEVLPDPDLDPDPDPGVPVTTTAPATKTPAPEKSLFISVDLEFTDGFPHGEIMQLGAVVITRRRDERDAHEDRFEIPTLPVKGPANPWVKENLGALHEACLATPAGVAYTSLREFVRWVEKHKAAAGADKVHMVTWCGTSDWSLLARDLDALGLDNPFSYTCHEIQTLVYVAGLADLTSQELGDYLYIPENTNPHNALADAEYQGRLWTALCSELPCMPGMAR